MTRPQVAEHGDLPAVDEPARLRVDQAWRVQVLAPGLFQDAFEPDPVRQRLPPSGSLLAADEQGEPRRGAHPGHDAAVGIDEAPEDLVAHAGGDDQVERVIEIEPRVAPRVAAAYPRRLFDHRPDARDELEV